MKQMKKKWKGVLSLLMAVVMLVSLMPQTALAGGSGTENGSTDTSAVTVYLTVSDDGKFVAGNDEEQTVMYRVPITVEYFDLGDYGLQEYYRFETEGNENNGQYINTTVVEQPTVLHLYIKAIEQFYLGGGILENGTEAFTCEGGATSLYMTSFWGHNCNLMYFVNHEYPLMSNGWGATADYLLLEDGTEIDIAMFTDFGFFSYGAFARFDKTEVTAAPNEEITLTMLGNSTGTSVEGEYTTDVPMTYENVYCVTDLNDMVYDNLYDDEMPETPLKGTTDENGEITLSFDKPGIYYLYSGNTYYTFYDQGGDGTAPCVAPPYCVVTVEKDESAEQEAADKAAADAVMEKIGAIGEVSLESEEAIAESRIAYEALTEAQKALVSNVEVLTAAESRLAQLKKEAAEKAEQEAADKAAADAVMEKIGAIGEVSLESEEAIAESRIAYEALTEAQKALVSNVEVLTAAESRLAQLKKEAADKAEQEAANRAAAEAVITKINAIGEVSLESEAAISEARTVYDTLTEAQKELVTNVEVLTEAESRLAQLKKEAADKAEQEAADKAAAEAVITKINAIGEVSLESEAAISEARTAYEALTEAQKELVTNVEVLTEAESRLAQLKQEAADKEEQEAADKAAADTVMEKIEAIGEVSLESEGKISEARTAYEALTEAQKELVTNVEVLEAAESRLAQLKQEAADKEEQEAADKAAADTVMEKIEAIGEVSLESEGKISEARTAYEALTEAQKELVTNVEVLTEAESRLAQLKKEAADKEAADKEAADKEAAEKAEQEAAQKAEQAAAEKAKADKAAAEAVIAKITAIGEVSLESEEIIAEARTAYEALTTEQKKLVSNYAVLTDAETTLVTQQNAVKKGKKVTVGTNIYKITKEDLENGTVEFVKPMKRTQKRVTVPDTIEIYGVTYKVTSIGNKAFQKNTKLTSVIIGKNVTSIGSYAFDKCSSLKKLTLPSNVTKIGAYAFRNCKKLKTLTIQSKKMSAKTINKKAFKGLAAKTTIKVPSSKKKAYTKLYKKCGMSTKVKVN